MAKSRILPVRSSADTNSSADANELSDEALDYQGTEQLKQITEEVSPGNDDLFLMERDSNGAFRRVKGSNLPGGGVRDYASATKSDSYTILDADTARVFYLSGAGANKIFTLPTLADNLDKEFLLFNLDSTYELQIKGEGAENLSHLGITQNTIDVELEGSGIKVKAGATNWEVIGVEGAKLKSISGVLEVIYETNFTGTSDADAQTQIAHSVTASKIRHVSSTIYDGTGTFYWVYDVNTGAGATTAYQLIFDATYILITGVGARLQGQAYTVKMDYYI